MYIIFEELIIDRVVVAILDISHYHDIDWVLAGQIMRRRFELIDGPYDDMNEKFI